MNKFGIISSTKTSYSCCHRDIQNQSYKKVLGPPRMMSEIPYMYSKPHTEHEKLVEYVYLFLEDIYILFRICIYIYKKLK